MKFKYEQVMEVKLKPKQHAVPVIKKNCGLTCIECGVKPLTFHKPSCRMNS